MTTENIDFDGVDLSDTPPSGASEKYRRAWAADLIGGLTLPGTVQPNMLAFFIVQHASYLLAWIDGKSSSGDSSSGAATIN